MAVYAVSVIVLLITLFLGWVSYKVYRSRWHKLLKLIALLVTVPATLFFAFGTAISIDDAIDANTSPEVLEKRLQEAKEREAAKAELEAQEAAEAEREAADRAAEIAAQQAAERAEKAENNRKGFHCLSSWDGSHSDFKRAVKDMMRNPSSFEHVETRVTPVKDGQHTVMMTYRAENGFGGTNVGQAIGTYSNATCDFTILSVE